MSLSETLKKTQSQQTQIDELSEALTATQESLLTMLGAMRGMNQMLESLSVHLGLQAVFGPDGAVELIPREEP